MRTDFIKVLVAVSCVVCYSSINVALAAEHTVDQHEKAFEKDGKVIEKMSVKVGDTVHFRNMDPWFHNVFSLSDIKTFDLGSFPKGQSKPVVFDKAGISQVECAIHPQMQLEVEVK
ncbi:MAG: methylamine utilization protein [Gammaproteobacteria bacterium]|nr:methylamine utilization protein [Gammaproteobacteria bacterium]